MTYSKFSIKHVYLRLSLPLYIIYTYSALSKPSLKEHVHPILNTKQLPFALPWAPSFALASYLNDNYKFGVGIGVANAGGLQESCAMKSSIGFFGGAAMGGVLGIFLGAMSDMTPPVTVINGKEVPQAPVKEQMRTVIRATGEKAMYWSRNFAFITGERCLLNPIIGNFLNPL